jgi:NADPH:quinone reductase-like Zn-dependent oxidoreductase
MKAIVYTHYGSPDVLQLKEVEKPEPRDGQVLVRVHAAALNYVDTHLISGEPFIARFWSGLRAPKHKIPGADIAGRVESIGGNVKQFQTGDEVFGDLAGCGWGGLAEYVSVPEEALAKKPAGLTFEQAAAVPQAGVSALQSLNGDRKIRPGQKVLIVGASGGVGTFAVQIAKALGAEVTGVCSTHNVELVRSIGADHIIDYTREDFAGNGRRYDRIVATAGYHSIFDYRRALNPQGMYVMIGGSLAQKLQAVFLGPWITMSGNKKMGGLMGQPNAKDLIFMKELLEIGKIVPVIDRRYPLSQAADAFRYLGAGHARGKVVITVK